MKRYHIIRRLILLVLLLVVGAAPVMAKHKPTKSSAHSSSSHKAGSKKSGSHKASSRKSSRKSASRRSSGRRSGYHRGWSRRAAPMAAEALPELGATAPLDPNDPSGGSAEPAMVDTMAQARDAMSRGDPAEALGRYLRVLARNPGDLEALSGAGGAALAVGDADAAINFYSRAEKIAPRDGSVKAGLGSALVQKEQPRAALRLFDSAVDLGVAPASVALDRGLAYDLRGDNRRAQQEYGLVLRSRTDSEATRRMALSMAMAGDRTGALTVLDPLLRRQDIPAWRARAFVLAMTGDAMGAEQAAYAVLPRAQANELKPFLERLPQLKASEKAAAVHFGHFPEDKVPQLVDVSPVSSGKSSPVVATPPPPVSAYSYDSGLRAPVPAQGTPQASASSLPTVYRSPAPADVVDNSAAIAAAQAKADAIRRVDERKQADRKAAAEKAAEKAATERVAQLAAEKKKAKEEAKARSSDPERYWVQIASGAYKPDLDKELAKQKSKYGKQLAGKTAWTTPYKATNRLLVGPFASKDAAQDYVNEVRKQGLSSFPVTTSAGQKVERLE